MENNIHSVVAKAAIESLIHRKQVRHETLDRVQNAVLFLGSMGVDTSKLDIFSDKKGGVFMEYSIFDHVDPAMRSMCIIRVPNSKSTIMLIYNGGKLRTVDSLGEIANFIRTTEGVNNVQRAN